MSKSLDAGVHEWYFILIHILLYEIIDTYLFSKIYIFFCFTKKFIENLHMYDMRSYARTSIGLLNEHERE